VHRGREGKGREGKGREGKGREGKGREGKGRKGEGRGGKVREGRRTVPKTQNFTSFHISESFCGTFLNTRALLNIETILLNESYPTLPL
jgi:hypothetical protein